MTTNTTKNNAHDKNDTPSFSTSSSSSSSYYAIVVDSGFIIKHDVQNLIGKANMYITTPLVLREIRDSKARQYLELDVLPLLDLKIREPSDESIQDIIAFAKQTGDYASLSTVDLHVLALTLEVERENNNSSHHIRTTPKRKIGLGSIIPMNNNNRRQNNSNSCDDNESQQNFSALDQENKTKDERGEGQEMTPRLLANQDYDEVEDDDSDDDDDQEEENGRSGDLQTPSPSSVVKKSWSGWGNPLATSNSDPNAATVTTVSNLPFASTKIPSSFTTSTTTNATSQNRSDGGQFDDASDDEDILQIHEDLERKKEKMELEFPGLLAASAVPYEGSDEENEDYEKVKVTTNNVDEKKSTRQDHKQHKKKTVFLSEEEKQKNLQPISKSGRVYNSFRNYKGLMKPKPVFTNRKQISKKDADNGEDDDTTAVHGTSTSSNSNTINPQEPYQQGSRLLGGGGGGECMFEDDDDGQGWITSSDDIRLLKTEGGGRLDPGKAESGPGGHGQIGSARNNINSNVHNGPPMSQRTACATTDFAMQNVLLQMNLILLSMDGMRIRRLKSWVIRCGACYKIHGADEDFKDDSNHYMKRLFCSHCGSGDMMQRISASVDGKTGRLKLHFSKRKQGRHHSIRGTKFSLPKPGSGNRFKGDLLLREDQLLSGAWNQKLKINSGMKYQTSRSQSIFGSDIASSVGCNVRSMSSASFGGKGWSTSANTSSGGFGPSGDDIKVGFGARKNPNAAKGRERRGKKKKSHDRACGMRRY